MFILLEFKFSMYVLCVVRSAGEEHVWSTCMCGQVSRRGACLVNMYVWSGQ